MNSSGHLQLSTYQQGLEPELQALLTASQAGPPESEGGCRAARYLVVDDLGTKVGPVDTNGMSIGVAHYLQRHAMHVRPVSKFTLI